MRTTTPRSRRFTRLGAGIATLALIGAGTVIAAAPAMADTGGNPITISGNQLIGDETEQFDTSTLSGSAGVSATAHWSQPAAVSVDWNPDLVRQGRSVDPSVGYQRTATGTLSIDYKVQATLTLHSGDPFGDVDASFSKTLTATGPCNLRADSTSYTCHLESGSVGILDPGEWLGVGLPYVDGSLQSEVTIDPQAIATHRTATTSSGIDLGSADLALGENPQTDALSVGCRIPAGDTVAYAHGGLSANPGIHVDTNLALTVGIYLPNPVTVTPGIATDIYTGTTTIAHSDSSIAMTGDGDSLNLGAVKANNIPPTLGAVTMSPNAVEGSAVSFQTSATGPCTAGATYSWDFGDGSSPGHTSSPKHVYPDNGTYTGQVVVTDTTGLTDRQDFTVDVANAAPNVTVIPGAPVTVPWGKPLTLQAQAVDPGSADQSTLTYAWNFDDGDSIANGGTSATHQWAGPGDRTPTVTVTDKDGGSTTKTFTVHVRAHDTTVSYTGPNSGRYNVPMTLTGSLVDEFGTPVTGAPMAFSVDGTVVGTATTDAAGHASLGYSPQALAGAHTIAVAYAGSTKFTADASATEPLQIGADQTTLTYTGGVKGAPNKAVAVSATLVDSQGRPLPGQSIAFAIGSQHVTASTNASGVAAASITLNQKPAYYPLSASFAGQTGKYQSASFSGQFSLNKK
jgi:PKD repeat protein